MVAIYKRELKAYFTSMIAPLFIAVVVLVTGIYFMAYNMNYGYPYFSYTLSSVLFIFMLVIPVLTMRSMSDERKSKTDQMLLTAPVSVTTIVMGKYLAMITIVAIPTLLFCLCPLIIQSTGVAYLAVDYASILAFYMTGCAFTAIGMLISAMTESQIISAVGTFGALLLINMMSGIASFVPSTAIASLLGFVLIVTVVAGIAYLMTKNWALAGVIEVIGVIALVLLYLINSSVFEGAIANLLSIFALTEVYYVFSQDYVFDVVGLVRLISAAFLCIFLTVQVTQKRRWS